MKASLSDLAVELRLEASGLADSKLINNIARRPRDAVESSRSKAGGR